MLSNKTSCICLLFAISSTAEPSIMISSFTSICIVITTLLASRTAATADLGNWNMTHLSTTTNFEQGGTKYIKLTYLIGTGQDWNMTLYAEDCVTPLDMPIPNPYDNQDNLAVRTQTANSAEEQLEIILDLEKLVINDAPLSLCSSLQLWSAGTIIKEE